MVSSSNTLNSELYTLTTPLLQSILDPSGAWCCRKPPEQNFMGGYGSYNKVEQRSPIVKILSWPDAVSIGWVSQFHICFKIVSLSWCVCITLHTNITGSCHFPFCWWIRKCNRLFTINLSLLLNWFILCNFILHNIVFWVVIFISFSFVVKM